MADKDLYEVINENAKTNINNIHTAIPCRVVDFNGHTATIEPMIKKILNNGELVDIPPLVDVIAQFPHAGGFCFTVPIKAGDEGLAIFSERCIDGWYATGEKSEPLDKRTYDYSDAIFIVGVNSVPKKIPDFYHDGASMQTDDGSTHIRLTNGTIYITGNIVHQGNTLQTGNVTLTGNTNQTGTITADKVIGGGIDLELHIHPHPLGSTGIPIK